MKAFKKRTPFLSPLAARLRRTLFRSHKPFSGSERYWIERYMSGGNSGAGSYNKLAAFKKEIVNDFVKEMRIATVLEFGCGDGNQLALAEYPSYLGLDISPKAVELCRQRTAHDRTKTVMLMSDYRGEKAQLTLSLDVIFHLTEDPVFDKYMSTLFDSSEQYVIIYSSNTNENPTNQPPHVRHRKFTEWVERNRRDWKPVRHVPNRFPFTGDIAQSSFADFYIYEKDVVGCRNPGAHSAERAEQACGKRLL